MCPLPMDCAKALWTRCVTASTPGLGEGSLLAEGEDMDLIHVMTRKLHAAWCAYNGDRDALMFLTQWKGVHARIALHVASKGIRDPWVICSLLGLLQRVHGCRGWNPFWVFN